VLDGPLLAHALSTARDTAYKGVVRPVEGTILTVTKDIAVAAEAITRQSGNHSGDLDSFLEHVTDAADASVQRTPELLPVLKEAGVVDSGGKGLFFILEGMLRYVRGQPLEGVSVVQPLAAMKFDEHLMEMVEEGQDFEVVLDFHPDKALDFENFYNDLEKMGTSIQLGEGEGVYRLHIHVPTEKRYQPIDYALSLGNVTKVTMENLSAQVNGLGEQSHPANVTFATVEPGQNAAIAVVPGPGIARVFASLGVAAVVDGGQTMNPSTQEILQAFENLPTDKIIILPNNKNIILAAQTAASLTVKKVAVIPCKSVPQGLSAMLHWLPDIDFDDLKADMTAALSDVLTGEITNATRSIELNGVPIKEGEIIGLLDGDLVVSSNDLQDACLQLLDRAQIEKYELITLFYGASVSKQQAYQVADAIRSIYPQQEVEVQDGGQPHYHFIIGIE
jgi:DAK2 domain fusion protein YloV